MSDIGPLNIDVPSVPLVNAGDYLPDSMRQARRQPIIPNQPRAATALQNKYAPGAYFDVLEQSGTYASHAINALRKYDEQRVGRGQAPLTETQTTSALAAASTQTPTTPAPQRSLNPLSIPGNAIKDLGNILKSIPRLPGALLDEVRSLDEIGESVASAPNVVAGLANAPGIRLLPGAFIAGSIASGKPGDLLRNPLFTALDVLPFASAAAKTTKVVKAATEIAEGVNKGTLTIPAREALVSQRMAKRPLTTALTKTLDDSGSIVNTTVGDMAQVVKDSKLGNTMSGYFGQPSRNAMYAVNAAMQRVRNIMQGTVNVPDNVFAPLGVEAVKYDTDIAALGFDEARMPELYDRLQRGDWNTDPVTVQAMEMTRDFNARLADVLQEQQLAVMFDNELYDLGQGIKLKQYEKGLDTFRSMTQLRGRLEAGVIAPENINVTSVVNDMLTAFDKPRAPAKMPPGSPVDRLTRIDQVSMAEIKLLHNSTIRQLRSAGYDTRDLTKAWEAVEGRTYKAPKNPGRPRTPDVAIDPQRYADKLREVMANPDVLPKLSISTIDEAVSQLKALSRDPKAGAGARDALFGIQNKQWTVVTKGLDQLKRTGKVDKALINRLVEIRETGRFIDARLGKFGDKPLRTRERNFANMRAQAVPARYIPEVGRVTKDKMVTKLIDVNGVQMAEEINKLADQGMWEGIPGFDPGIYRKVQRETAQSWLSWRAQAEAQGVRGPVYVHTVTPNKANAAINPYATIVPRSPSSVKKRMLDMAPGVKNVGVSMTHQMMELISKQQIEIAIKQIMDQMGESEFALRERFAPMAERRAKVNPSLDFEGHLQKAINERYKRFDPETEGYAWGSPYLSKLKQDGVFIPVSVARNLKMLAEPKRLLGGLLDPITNTFRAATTSLSLRTQVYNAIGGGVMLELQRPGAMARSGAKALAWMRDPTLVPDILKEQIGSQKNLYMDLDREALGAVNEGVYSYLKGKTLKRFFDGEQAAKVPGRPITRFKGIKGLVEKSYTLNGTVDDFYRMATFIDTYDNSVGKGFTVEAAEREAIVSTRQVLQDWMSMTPVERSVIRSIIPFYGFVSHAMRFVARYPFDHPLRTEFMTKLAMAEMEDNQHLPGRFMSMLFMGGLGPNGEQNALNVGPFNPFGDIANYMTVSGVMGATNPVISTLLEQAGVVDGKAELYPSLQYDANSGRLSNRTNNPLLALLHNTLPQSSVITAMLGVNEDYNDMLRRDPAAARRYLASGLTIPITWRQIQVDQEVMKAEVARQTAAEKAKNEALKSGDWNRALLYPSLAEFFAMIDQMPEEQKASFVQMTPEQISAITQQTPNVALPQFQGVEPLDTTINTLLEANRAGVVLPGSSLTNTTGGI